MTMETALQTGLKFGLVVNLDSGWDFDVAKHCEAAIDYIKVEANQEAECCHSFNICQCGSQTR